MKISAFNVPAVLRLFSFFFFFYLFCSADVISTIIFLQLIYLSFWLNYSAIDFFCFFNFTYCIVPLFLLGSSIRFLLNISCILLIFASFPPPPPEILHLLHSLYSILSPVDCLFELHFITFLSFCHVLHHTQYIPLPSRFVLRYLITVSVSQATEL